MPTVNWYTQQIRTGHWPAWNALVARYSPKLKNFFLRRGFASQAEDLTSEVLAITWQKRTNIQVDQPVASWLFAVAHNLAKRAKRTLARQRTEPLFEVPVPEDDRHRAECRLLVQEELDGLEANAPTIVQRGRAWLATHCDSAEAARRLGCRRRTMQAAVTELKSRLRKRWTKSR